MLDGTQQGPAAGATTLAESIAVGLVADAWFIAAQRVKVGTVQGVSCDACTAQWARYQHLTGTFVHWAR